jgi:hypothetical protein
VAADYSRQPARPVVMAEGAYEGTEFGRTQTAHDIRKQAYWSQLAGGHHVYGHNDNYAHPRQWRDWLDAPGVKSLSRFRELINALPGWHEMVPDQAILGATAGTGFGRHVAARAADGAWCVAYVSVPGTVTMQLAAPGRSAARGEWINPADGSRLSAGRWAMPRAVDVSVPAGWEDGVLVVSFS